MKIPATTAFLLALLAGPAAAQFWAEEAKFVSPSTVAGDEYGDTVSVSGDTAVVGSHLHDGAATDSGAAYVVRRTGTDWTQEQELVASDTMQNHWFGASVAIDGDTVVVGACGDDDNGNSSGAAYVFVRGGTTWTEQAKLLASDGFNLDRFGAAVAFEGDRVLVGAPRDDDFGSQSGAAYVFERSGTTWTEVQKLTASDASAADYFGSHIELSGNAAIVGAPTAQPSGVLHEGAAYVFELAGTTWSETALLIGEGEQSDRFGSSVSISGDTAVVGAPRTDSSSLHDAGAVFVYERSGTTWVETERLTCQPPQVNDLAGWSVAIDDDTLIFGAIGTGVAGGPYTEAGSAILYRKSDGRWVRVARIEASDALDDLDHFGWSADVSGELVVVGAPDADDAGLSSGAVYGIGLGTPADVTPYCTAGISFSGCQAFLLGTGVPSATAPSGFHLMSAGMEGAKEGLFFYGTNGRQAVPWGPGTSYVCVVPPRVRGGLLTAFGSMAGGCDGALTQDLNARWCPTCPKPVHNPGPGAVMQAQMWYRDLLSPSGKTSSMSNAIEFTMQP